MPVMRTIFTKLGFKADTKGLDTVEKKSKAVEKGMKQLAVAGIALGAALTYAAVKAIGFEKAMVEVSTLVDTSTTDMQKLTQQVRELSIEYGSAPVDTAKALYTTISAGFGDAAQATILLNTSLKLAKGGMTDVNVATDGLTSIMNAYGLGAEHATDISDAMFVAMRDGKTTIAELASGIGAVVPFAAAAGVSIDELLASTAALTLGGLDTKLAFTSLKNIIASTIKPTSQQTAAAKKYGFELSLQALKTKGLLGFMNDMKKTLGDNKEAYTELFPNIRAIAGVLAIAGKQGAKFNAIMDDMDNKSGATEVAFQKVYNTAGEALKRLKAAFDVTAETFTVGLLPIISKLADGVTDLLKVFQKLGNEYPNLTRLLTLLTVMISTVLILGGAFAVAAAAASVFSAAVITALLPIYGIMLLIIAFVAVIALFIQDLYVGLTGGKSVLFDAFKTLFQEIGIWVDETMDKIYKFANDVANILSVLMKNWDININFSKLTGALDTYSGAQKNKRGPSTNGIIYDFIKGKTDREYQTNMSVNVDGMTTVIEGNMSMGPEELTDSVQEGNEKSIDYMIKQMNYSSEGGLG